MKWYESNLTKWKKIWGPYRKELNSLNFGSRNYKDYDRELCLIQDEVIDFIKNTQPEKWDKLIEININCYWRILKELEPIIKNSLSPKIIFINNSKISNGKPYHNILSISQAALKTIANIYKSENKRLGIDTRIIELPNLANGITSMTVGEKKLFSKNFTKKIIKESFI